MEDVTKPTTLANLYLEVLRTIGAGTMSTVSQVVSKVPEKNGTCMHYAYKPGPDHSDPKWDDDLDGYIAAEHSMMSEIRFLSMLHHPNIIKLVHVIAPHGLLMEYMDYTLDYYIKTLSQQMTGDAWPNLIDQFTLDLFSGLMYMHTLKDYKGMDISIVHLDIKPANLLISKDEVL
jgi:serine/threonine protein kinase